VKKLMGALALLAAAAVVVLSVGVATAAPLVSQVCAGGDSGKVDVLGDDTTMTLTAPDGYLISGYCVKAGSAKQGLGAEWHALDPPAASVEISHSSGKAISHYSYTLVESEGAPECPPEGLFCGEEFGE
jgi:hypothetical protein